MDEGARLRTSQVEYGEKPNKLASDYNIYSPITYERLTFSDVSIAQKPSLQMVSLLSVSA